MCNCRMNSDPNGGDPEALLDQAKYFPDTGRPTVAVDRCIAPQIEALWAAGVRTRACCCGHNNQVPMAPMVALDDPTDAGLAFAVLAEDDRNWWINICAGKDASLERSALTGQEKSDG